MLSKIKKNKLVSTIYFLLKRISIFLSQVIYMPYRLKPIKKNSIYIVSYYGQGYGDSAKTIVQEILSLDIPFDIYWAVNDLNNHNLPEEVIPIKYGSRLHYKFMSTSKFWIDNSRKYLYPFKRKEQLYIQTWHGGISLKKIEMDASQKLSDFYIKNALKDSKNIDLFISNSNHQTETIRRAFSYSGEVLECGTPRVDRLLNSNLADIEKIKKQLRIDKYKKIVLYAPTFRNVFDNNVFLQDHQGLIDLFGEECVILQRMHPNDQKNSKTIEKGNVIDVTNYPDLYELMIVSDILITDYSSSMFEYSFMKKPVFLLTKDLESYNEERGTYFEIEDLPFSSSLNEKKLLYEIKMFDKKIYDKNVADFHKKIQVKETGFSGKQVAMYIVNRSGCDSN